MRRELRLKLGQQFWTDLSPPRIGAPRLGTFAARAHQGIASWEMHHRAVHLVFGLKRSKALGRGQRRADEHHVCVDPPAAGLFEQRVAKMIGMKRRTRPVEFVSVERDIVVDDLAGVPQDNPSRQIRDRLPILKHVVSIDGKNKDALAFSELVDAHPSVFEVAKTGPDDPALMIFTSGTTGPPKGALHGHRVLPGHIPGMQFAHEGFPKEGDKVWTPSDWAWAGGLLNALLPSLLLGVPVVSSPAQKFDADMAYRIMAEMKVRNAFIPPTALRLMRSVADPRSKYDLVLRTIGSAGEALGRETYEWARRTLGITVNEFYGQTECNFVLSSSAAYGVTRAGAIGRTVPGHRVAIVDEAGEELPVGEPGQIAIASPDPVMFLGYWNDAAATERKFVKGWLLTGDIGRQDADGYITFEGRDDDVITSSGYRIGPAEIEDCLIGHPAVQLAAAIGKPDAVRTEIVKAYIVLSSGHSPSEALATDIREWVKMRLSMHEYPREVEFIDSLPLTTTGKVIRRLLRERAAAEG